MADPDWRGGEYRSEGVFPAEGLAIARMIAMVTFHSQESMESGSAAGPRPGPVSIPSFGGTFDVEGYIHYHGRRFVRRFDANSHLYLTRAMDLYDVARDGGEEHWLREIDGADAADGDPERLALPAGRGPGRLADPGGRRSGRMCPTWSSIRRTATMPS